jgi:peptidylprolyl isomerase
MTTLVRTSLLSLLLAGAVSVSAQTAAPAAKAPVHHAAATATPHTTVAAKPATCSTDIPPLSPKIPALPAGSPCPKPLYTLTSTPGVKLSYVAPVVNPGLAEELGLDSSSFSLSYVDTKIGAGPLAQPHMWYTIHYTGYLTDGTKFDSSLDRGEPISIDYGKHMVIPGWDTGFDGMHVGGKRRLFIPFQLAYGATAHGPIPARSALVFDVELVSQSATQPAPKTPPAPPTPAAKPGDAKPATPAAPAPGTTTPAAPASGTTTPAPATPPSTPKQ